ncbi:MAG: 1-deoxy-D-xylulose-5-phosphate synthase, partial [Clostridia bacterium]|nr:1-deoxy-D-xylulose-5-phosphate synthase [Clostridia bacterium]
MKILDKINYPSDIKELSSQQLNTLAGEIRSFLVQNVLVSGGHLASNLGVVELTLALHKVFDFSDDRIIFDVGHQAYVHKILTGRKNSFDTLRRLNGLSGFPKRSESIYDAFDVGHASTSISAAVGMARGRDLMNKKHNVIAFLGDGALTGGMTFEALNDIGQRKSGLIIVLNDNEMAIEKNVGGLSAHLGKLHYNQKYSDTKSAISRFLDKKGKVGKNISGFLESARDKLKLAAMAAPYFESIGIKYIGIIDGHNIEELVSIFEKVKDTKEPVIIHTYTKKGYGYKQAEESPDKYHGVGRQTVSIKRDEISYSEAFGEILQCIADDNQNVVAISAAMLTGCGLSGFYKKFPDRTYDVGIAEEHAVTMAAGMATAGLVPVVCIYSTFLQRAYDQIIHDVSMQNLHVIFAIDRAGLVGEDGETHQGVFDLSYLSHIPNLTVLTPSCYQELKQMMEYAVNECSGPVAVRYPKAAVSFRECTEFVPSCAEVVSDGTDTVVFACGRM